jgi:phytol kinase
MNPAIAMAVILGCLGGLMLGVRALQSRGGVGAETGRKLVHLGMGTISLFLPWLFRSPGLVWALALTTATGLVGVRILPAVAQHLGGVLGGVNRASLGEIYFPLGVALSFALAHTNRAAYCAAIGALTFADSAGALIGGRYGRSRYSARSDAKSIEGSTAVLVASVLCATLALIWPGGESWTSALAGGLLIGAAATVVEAIAGRGLDNLLLPLAVVGLIKAWSNHTADFPRLRWLCLIGVGFSFVVFVAGAGLSARRRKTAVPLEVAAKLR